MNKTKQEKDLGVISQDDSPEEHINRIDVTTYKNIRTAFTYFDKDMMKILVTVIRPKLEYTHCGGVPREQEERYQENEENTKSSNKDYS